MEIFRQIRAKEKRKENIGRSNNFLVTHLNTMVVVNKKKLSRKNKFDPMHLNFFFLLLLLLMLFSLQEVKFLAPLL